MHFSRAPTEIPLGPGRERIQRATLRSAKSLPTFGGRADCPPESEFAAKQSCAGAKNTSSGRHTRPIIQVLWPELANRIIQNAFSYRANTRAKAKPVKKSENILRGTKMGGFRPLGRVWIAHTGQNIVGRRVPGALPRRRWQGAFSATLRFFTRAVKPFPTASGQPLP